MTVQKLMNLKGRRALITGATGGLGTAIAETLAELNADLILVDHPRANFSSLEKLLEANWGIKVWSYHCDLEQNDQRSELLDLVKNDHDTLNILINNAAFVGSSDLQGWGTSFEDQTVETWRRALEVNLTAPFHLCQGLTPLLKNSKEANIINIGSIYGEYGPDWRLYDGTSMANPAAYGTSKGGLIQFTRWLSTTLAPGIRVNAISPGGIFRDQPDLFVKQYELRTPLARMATENDFRGIIAYLASDMSSYVTGQVFSIDGGWGVW